jgi:DNA polymerase
MGVSGRECGWYRVCPLRRFYERGELSGIWIDRYCRGGWEACVRYRMEETGQPHADWMLPDGTTDERLRRLCRRGRE